MTPGDRVGLAVLDFIARHQPRVGLDAGCGIGEYSGLYAEWLDRLDVVDAHEPYIVATKRRLQARTNVSYHVGELPGWLTTFAPFTWDAAFCVDVLEHLEKPDALDLLANLVITARHVLVFTPAGFMPQETDAWKLGGEHWQKHRSGWTAEELRGLGFHVETWTDFHGPAQHALLATSALRDPARG